MRKSMRARLTAVVGALAVGSVAVAGAVSAAPVPIYGEPDGDAGPIEIYENIVGPIHLDEKGGAHWEDHSNGAIPKPAIDVPGQDYFAIRGATFDLVDAEGMTLPRDQPATRPNTLHPHGWDGLATPTGYLLPCLSVAGFVVHVAHPPRCYRLRPGYVVR